MLRVRPAQLTTTSVSGRYNFVNTIDEFRARCADPRWYRHQLVFVDRSTIEYRDICSGLEQTGKFSCVDRRRAMACSTNSPNALLGTLTPLNSS